MNITLTLPELATLEVLRVGDETVEQALHRILAPIVAKNAEARLQGLANMYRQLSPEDQVEAITVLREWQISKLSPPVPVVEEPPVE